MFVGEFETPSLSELLAQCPGSEPGSSVELGLAFEHVADPVGVVSLIADPRNAGAVFQAASQFNCLEMVGPGVSPRAGVTNYFLDPTQGPKCALACPAGTVYRNYFAGPDPQKRGQGVAQIDCLSDVARVLTSSPSSPSSGPSTAAAAAPAAALAAAPRKQVPWVMRNGYALPVDATGIGNLGKRLVADPGLDRDAQLALRVGVHWDTAVRPPATHSVAQVYVSAMPVAYA